MIEEMAAAFGILLIASCMVVGVNGQSVCLYQGKEYQPYTKVYSKYDESKNWCNVGICKSDGTIWRLVDLACPKATLKPTTEMRKTIPTTQAVLTEHATKAPKDCIHEGQRFPHGSEIFRGVENNKKRCFIQVCMGGKVIMRNYNCYTSTTTVTAQPNIPTTTSGCYYNGKHYPLDSVIDRGYDSSSNWCYGTNCDSIGQIEHWDNFECHTTTSRPITIPETTTTTTPPSPPTTIPEYEFTTPPFTTPFGCYDNGKFYAPGDEINKGYDEATDWCYGTYCDRSGSMVSWDAWNCKKKHLTTEELPVTTAEIPTTLPFTTSFPTTTEEFTTPSSPGCYKDGKYYSPGSHLSEGYDKSSDRCYGSYCTYDGRMIPWDDWNCKRKDITTPPPTTTPPSPSTPVAETTPPTYPTTLPPTTAPPQDDYTTPPYPSGLPGCYDNGKYFPPGSPVSEGYDESSDWCYGVYCDHNGEMYNWDTWNCKRKDLTTAPPTTAFPITTPPFTTPEAESTAPPYPKTSPEKTATPTAPQEEESTAHPYPKTSSEQTAPPTTAQEDESTVPLDRRTRPPTTVPPYASGCFSGGKVYPLGSDIHTGYDESTDWCYGTFCSGDGSILQWDTWNCKGRKTTTEMLSYPPTTFPPTEPTTEATTTEAPPPTTTPVTTVSMKGCWYDGILYPEGREVYNRWDKNSRWCYGLVCHNDGTLVYWEKWNCSIPTVTPVPSLPPAKSEAAAKTSEKSGCVHKGKFYYTNQFIVKTCDDVTKKCSMLFCNRLGKIVPKLVTDITRQKEISKQNLKIQNTKDRLANDGY